MVLVDDGLQNGDWQARCTDHTGIGSAPSGAQAPAHAIVLRPGEWQARPVWSGPPCATAWIGPPVAGLVAGFRSEPHIGGVAPSDGTATGTLAAKSIGEMIPTEESGHKDYPEFADMRQFDNADMPGKSTKKTLQRTPWRTAWLKS